MDRQHADELVNDAISREMESMFPHGAGQANSHRVEHALRQVAERAFTTGQSYALLSLLTADDLAEMFGVTPRRIRALARARNAQMPIGWQVPGTNQWLFRPEEVEQLRPDEKYRRK